jgi:hypothetical protein
MGFAEELDAALILMRQAQELLKRNSLLEADAHLCAADEKLSSLLQRMQSAARAADAKRAI